MVSVTSRFILVVLSVSSLSSGVRWWGKAMLTAVSFSTLLLLARSLTSDNEQSLERSPTFWACTAHASATPFATGQDFGQLRGFRKLGRKPSQPLDASDTSFFRVLGGRCIRPVGRLVSKPILVCQQRARSKVGLARPAQIMGIGGRPSVSRPSGALL